MSDQAVLLLRKQLEMQLQKLDKHWLHKMKLKLLDLIQVLKQYLTKRLMVSLVLSDFRN